MKIYVASSWRNGKQPYMIDRLKKRGYDVYDFRNPTEGNHGFHWSDIDTFWKTWDSNTLKENLNHRIAINGFTHDFIAMRECNVFLGLMPFGISASIEMGWAAGQGRTTILLLDNGEPELMIKLFDFICTSMKEVLSVLETLRG
jgi:hypothetical protein